MKQLVAEQLAYGVDGFHIDMPDQGFGPPYGCWCDACRKQFAAEFSRPMPKGVTWDEDWERMLEFRYRSSQRFEQALAAYVKSLNPRATIDFNYFGNPPFAWEVGQRPVQHAGNGDFVTGETGAWGFGALTTGLNAEFYRAATPGVPYQVAMQRGVRMYHDQTTRPLNDIRWELFTLLAHGAMVTMVDKTGFDGALDPVAYQRIGAALAEARSKRHAFWTAARLRGRPVLQRPHPRLDWPREARRLLPKLPGRAEGDGPGAPPLRRAAGRGRYRSTVEDHFPSSACPTWASFRERSAALGRLCRGRRPADGDRAKRAIRPNGQAVERPRWRPRGRRDQ